MTSDSRSAYTSTFIPNHNFSGIAAARGLAAVLVFLSHVENIRGTSFGYFFDPGKLGVVLFFFISGYLIPESLVSKDDSRQFWINRIFRLYPLYWISVGAAILLMNAKFSPWQILANFTMAQQFLGFDNVLAVYWTLTIELAFYFFITALFWIRKGALGSKLHVTYFLLGVIAVALGVARWIAHAKLPVALPMGLFVMFLGALMRRRHNDRHKMSILPFLYYLVIIVATCAYAYAFETRFAENPYRYIVSYLVALVLFFGFCRAPDHFFPPWSVVLGEISFGLYLFHPLAIHIVDAWQIQPFVRMAAAFAATLLASYVLHLIVEKPMIMLGRRVSKKIAAAK